MVNFSSFRRGGVNLRSRTKSLTKSYAAQSDKVMSENWDNGFITDEDYVSYLQGEVAGRAWLTPSQKTANTIKVSNVQERITETAFNDAYDNGTISTTDYITHKLGKLSGMTEGSLAYRNLQQDIYGLEDKIVAEQEQERTRRDAENKRLRNLQYSDSLLTISEWKGDTLSKAQGKVLALEGLVKDMEEYGDTVDAEGLPAKEYLSAQTRLNNAVETSGDLFRQHDQLRQELALNLSDLDTIPDLEGKRAIAEQMLQNAIESQDEMAYLRVANRIATIDDSLRNAYESEYKRGLGQAEKMEEERLGLELRRLDEDMAELEQMYQSGRIDSREYLGSKLEILVGNEQGGRGYAQVLGEKANSGAFTDSQRYRAGEKLRELSGEVEETSNLGVNIQRGFVQDVIELDKATGQEVRKPKWVEPSNVIDLTDPGAEWGLEDVLDEQGNFTGVYIRDKSGNLRKAELGDPGIAALKELGTENITTRDLFETGYLSVAKFDPQYGYLESRYNKDAGTWDTVQPMEGEEFLVGGMSGWTTPFGRPGATKVSPQVPVEERTTKFATRVEPVSTMTQAGVDVMKTPEYEQGVESQAQKAVEKGVPYESTVAGYEPSTKYEPPKKTEWEVPEVPLMPQPWEAPKMPGVSVAQPTQKAKDIISTMPYEKAVQTQAQKAVAKGVPYESTLAGWQKQQRKKKDEKKKGGIFGKVKSFFGW